MLVHSGCELIPKDLYDLVEDAGRDGDVFLDPWYVFDDRDLDRGNVVVMEPTLLHFGPC